MPKKQRNPFCSMEGCKVAIPLIQQVVGACACGGKFCSDHRLPETHNCHISRKQSEEDKKKSIRALECKASKI